MKKLLLYLLAILSPFIFISNVNAESQINWFENDTDKQPFVNVDAYNWSSYPSSYESLAISPARIYTRFFTDSTGSVVDDSWGGIKTDSSINVYTQGVSFTFQPNIRFVANYLYSVTFYVCNSVSSPFNATATIQKANTSALTGNMVYTYTNRNSVSNQLATDQVSCPYAYAYTSLVVPEVNGNYIAYRFTSSTSIRSQFLLLGYEIRELGIYNESLEASLTNIINSSGLATAKSINEVKSSINTMSSEITTAQNETNNKLDQTNEALGDINDSLTNSDAPDNMDGLSNSAGWLPAGPVDSIVNLPLALFNNLRDNLGGQCQDVTLTLPFVNKQFPLPCIRNLYAQIPGLNALIISVGTIAAGLMLYSYLIHLYLWVDNILRMRGSDFSSWGGV